MSTLIKALLYPVISTIFIASDVKSGHIDNVPVIILTKNNPGRNALETHVAKTIFYSFAQSFQSRAVTASGAHAQFVVALLDNNFCVIDKKESFLEYVKENYSTQGEDDKVFSGVSADGYRIFLATIGHGDGYLYVKVPFSCHVDVIAVETEMRLTAKIIGKLKDREMI